MKDILISSSVLILALVLLRFLFRKTISRRVQYALWGLALLRLLIPVSLPAMKYSVLTAAEPVRETAVWETASQISGLHVPRMSYTRAYGEVMAEHAAEAAEGPLSDSELEIRAYARMASPLTLRDALRLVWYAGMGLMALLFLAVNLRYASRLRRTRVPLEGAECRYPVYLCDDIPTPCLFGLFRPAVYVTSLAARDETSLRCVLAHEEAHGRRLDPLWSLLRSLCLVIWWFDPLVWLAARCSRIDGELACDESVLLRLGEEQRMAYGETLLRLIPLGRGGNPMLASTAMTAGKRQMRDRIRRIAEHRRPLVIALAAVLVLAAVLCAVTFTGAKGAATAPAPDPVPTGVYGHARFAGPEAYLDVLRGQRNGVSYETEMGERAVAWVTETRVASLRKLGELSGLAPEGTLELYTYLIQGRLAPETEVSAYMTGITEDGWCDLTGEGEHVLVLLRYPDGTAAVLLDRACGDDLGGLYYDHNSPEEMLHDWYAREYDPELPPYTLDLKPEDGRGSHPARRYDGDGWYIYIPLSGWEERNGEAKWVSHHKTGSSIAIREASREELTAERPALMQGQEERFVEGEDGRLWLVFTQYDPLSITDTAEIRDEPRLLEAMLESFAVPGGREVLRRSWEHSIPPTLTERLGAAADRIFGAYDAPGSGYFLAVEAEGRRDEYAVDRDFVPRWDGLSTGYWLQKAYTWEPLGEEEIAAVDRDPADGPVLTVWNESESFTVYALSGILCWTELADGTEHWLRSSGDAGSIFQFFLSDAREVEMRRPEAQITVPGTVTDYEEAARLMAEQYAAILLDRPSWYPGVPEDAAVNGVSVFDAYYGEDYPNFCFGMKIWLKLSPDPADPARTYFEAGSGLGDPVPDGPYAGWYGWGGEVTAALEEGQWRFKGMDTGGAGIWLPYGEGWATRCDRLTTEQLVSLCFLTRGRTHDWNLLYYLSQKPVEEVREELGRLGEDRRRQLLRDMEGFNAAYGEGYVGFDLEALA